MSSTLPSTWMRSERKSCSTSWRPGKTTTTGTACTARLGKHQWRSCLTCGTEYQIGERWLPAVTRVPNNGAANGRARKIRVIIETIYLNPTMD